ncbi:MAG: NAD(P)H-dependent oxidoreductase subunit E, partial [Deltaproteobacteria bacterium]|nr:NAD(P)H-dependent oxidoreductase subunit E [Deltaproteobacteria bacterium]
MERDLAKDLDPRASTDPSFGLPEHIVVGTRASRRPVQASKELYQFFEQEGLSEEQLAKLDEAISEYQGMPGALIPVLQRGQEIVGYLPPIVQQHIAKGLGVPESEVFSVVTFYSFFTMIPRGKHTIRVCLGTACYVRGGQRIVQKLQHELGVNIGSTTKDRLFTLETVRCLGCCSLAPVMLVGQNVHLQLDS